MNTHFCCGECFGDNILKIIIKDNDSNEIKNVIFADPKMFDAYPHQKYRGTLISYMQPMWKIQMVGL